MAQFPSNPALDSAAVPVRVVSSSASSVGRVANASDPSQDDSAVPVRIVGGGGVSSGTLTAPTAYAYADLPASPDKWQLAIITDKAIGSGTVGVMVMYNPTAKAWTGLSGESLS